jgi:hypothetical protein
MDSSFKLQYQGEEYSEIFWKYFRNGLAHGLCIERGGIERNFGCYFRIDPKIGLQVDIDYLIEDFRRAFEKFICRLKQEGDSGKFAPHFLQRFEDVFCK